MIGPLQTSASGNRHIITTIDYMTKNVEAAVVSDKSSKTTAEFFDREIICRQSTPAEVVSGQGGEFQGEFHALLDRCGNDHRLTSPYHPQAIGLTERANQTITRSLVKMTGEDPLNWDPKGAAGLQIKHTGFHQILSFLSAAWRPMVLPLGHRHRANMIPLYHVVPTDSAVTKQAERLTALGAEARANILRAQEKQKLSYASRQLHGSVGKDNQTELGTTPFGGLTAAQYLWLPIHEAELPLSAPSNTTIPVSEATVTELRAEQAAATQLKTLDIQPVTNLFTFKRRALQSLHLLQLLDPTQQPQLLPNQSLMRLHHQAELQSTRQLAKDVGNQQSFMRETLLWLGFTKCKNIAVIEDADGAKWTKRVADLSPWE
ncbi:hypothetical protein WJX77_004233 [Trebouxia sp. C0004]